MGGAITGAAGARAAEIYPPLAIAGAALRGFEYRSPIASAQVKSAILLAGLYAEGATAVIEPRRSRDHTERMLAALGVPIAVDGTRVELDAGVWDRRLPGWRYRVPGDPSSAAFIAVAALLAGGDPVRIESVCANPTRTGFIDALESMGAALEVEQTGDDAATLSVAAPAPGGLRGVRIAGELVVRAIDELPILAVAAALADGTTEIADAAELRVKESDRIATTAAMLRALGVEVDERDDGMAIEGTAGAPLGAAEIDAAGDHRIAMAAAVAGLVASGEVLVRDVSNVATSFPTFVDVLRQLGADIDVM
jgi:3-phosphoshikimate 1-carboxyvinyltransferase